MNSFYGTFLSFNYVDIRNQLHKWIGVLLTSCYDYEINNNMLCILIYKHLAYEILKWLAYTFLFSNFNISNFQGGLTSDRPVVKCIYRIFITTWWKICCTEPTLWDKGRKKMYILFIPRRNVLKARVAPRVFRLSFLLTSSISSILTLTGWLDLGSKMARLNVKNMDILEFILRSPS
jgi:hypothetical protein